MERDVSKLLWDALDSCRAIEEYTDQRSLQDFESDRKLRAAVEYEFIIIGESLNRLRKKSPETAARISELEQVIAFRNVVVHGYDDVRHERVWEITRTNLPKLRQQLELLTSEWPQHE